MSLRPDDSPGQPRATPREFLVTSYMLGAPDGQNLGAPGYSHEFVARLFCPLLQPWGEVRQVRGGRRELEQAADDCRRRGVEPVHFSVLPFQDTHLVPDATNIVVPAWEYPDVPDHAFDDNPQNDWPSVANRTDLVIVSGPFTEAALRRSGATAPIELVPVPTPDAYLEVAPWTPRKTTRIDSWAYVFPGGAKGPVRKPGAAAPPRERGAGRIAERGLRSLITTVLGSRRREQLSALIKQWRHNRRSKGSRPKLRGLPYPQAEFVDLSGIVYTSIFAPEDGRKNWRDMLTAFLHTLGDRADVTLVFKLIVKSRRSVEKVLRHFVDHLDRDRACKIVFFCDFLPDEQMLRLCEASTFYFQASKAEGNCLPLMNYLAAGRPGISPRHSSMSDYFDSHSGFVVDSNPEPCAWPHDRQLRIRTTWGRIVWPDLCRQIERSYDLVTNSPAEYRALAAEARTRMSAWAGKSAVQAKLDRALATLFQRQAAGSEIPPRRAA